MTETLEQIALLPCPFCGSEPLLVEHPAHKHVFVDMPDHPGSWTIECPACECGMIHQTKDGVVAAWNRRLVAELAKQEPVAYMNAKRDMTFTYAPYNADDIPLYLHNIPTPEEVRDAERWRTHVRLYSEKQGVPEQDVVNEIDAAMTAAQEGK